MKTNQPTLLCISGLDPTGGAGLQADIETTNAIGIRAVCAQTCNTVQSSAGTQSIVPTTPDMLLRQIEYLIADFDIAAVKIGLVVSTESAQSIAQAIAKIHCPIVVDPILKDGIGNRLCNELTKQAIRQYLLPLATCATPNLEEVISLVACTTTPTDAATTLLHEGCSAVLVTSEEKKANIYHHALYLPYKQRKVFSSLHLVEEFHGSGCTLSSALAAYLALGKPLSEAVSLALTFTAHAIEKATTPERSAKRKFPTRR